LDSDG
jgi:Histidine kinase